MLRSISPLFHHKFGIQIGKVQKCVTRCHTYLQMGSPLDYVCGVSEINISDEDIYTA